MDNVSRRRFLRDATFGAAALGVAATVGQDPGRGPAMPAVQHRAALNS